MPEQSSTLAPEEQQLVYRIATLTDALCKLESSAFQDNHLFVSQELGEYYERLYEYTTRLLPDSYDRFELDKIAYNLIWNFELFSHENLSFDFEGQNSDPESILAESETLSSFSEGLRQRYTDTTAPALTDEDLNALHPMAGVLDRQAKAIQGQIEILNDLSQKPIQPGLIDHRDFFFVEDEEARADFRSFMEEIESTFIHDLNISCQVMSFAMIEGLLRVALLRNRPDSILEFVDRFGSKKSGTNAKYVQKPELWKAFELIEISRRMSVITSECADLCNQIRIGRNNVHGLAKPRRKIDFSKGSVSVALHALQRVIDEISDYDDGNAK